MKEVTIVKYVGLDGHVYDEAKCEAADNRWREENEYDVEKEVARLRKWTRQERHRFALQEKYLVERGTSSFPRIYIRHDKHGDEHFVANNFNGIVEGTWEWFTIHCDKNYGYYTGLPRSNEISKRILELDDRDAAYAFVVERSEEDYEYERIDWEPVKVYE